eukprot:Skav214734  [mRNA]  locus=scaffold3176:39423:40037:+ [translate_table: standard]
MHTEASDPVESITVHLAGLEVTVTARRVGAASSVGPGTESDASGPEVSRPVWTSQPGLRAFPQALESQALAAITPSAFAALDLRCLRIEHRLHITSSEWTPAARLGRAFKAGLLARLHLDHESAFEESPAIPFRNQIYIVLRGSSEGLACWTRSHSVYTDRVFVLQGRVRDFASESVSHAFASQAEGSAYLAGARVTWPSEVNQ